MEFLGNGFIVILFCSSVVVVSGRTCRNLAVGEGERESTWSESAAAGDVQIGVQEGLSMGCLLVGRSVGAFSQLVR